MSYRYEDLRPEVFSEEGQKMFLSIRDNAGTLLNKSGAATMERIISGQTGSSWQMLACVDRLVEIGELLEIANPHSTVGQNRIFVKAKQ